MVNINARQAGSKTVKKRFGVSTGVTSPSPSLLVNPTFFISMACAQVLPLRVV